MRAIDVPNISKKTLAIYFAYNPFNNKHLETWKNGPGGFWLKKTG